MAPDDVCGELKVVIVSLINDLSMPTYANAADVALRRAAELHGSYRFSQGYPEQAAHMDLEFLVPPTVLLLQDRNACVLPRTALENCVRVAHDGVRSGYERGRLALQDGRA